MPAGIGLLDALLRRQIRGWCEGLAEGVCLGGDEGYIEGGNRGCGIRYDYT
jgi:hypothetical protein